MWKDLKVLNEKWASYIKPSNSKPVTMCGLIKIESNLARVITRRFGTATIEFIPIFVEIIYIKKLTK